VGLAAGGSISPRRGRENEQTENGNKGVGAVGAAAAAAAMRDKDYKGGGDNDGGEVVAGEEARIAYPENVNSSSRLLVELRS